MKIFFILIIVSSFASCYNPPRSCTAFKTGTFRFKTLINGKMETTTFYRTNTLEIANFRGKTDTSSVRWINDCELVVKNLNPRNRTQEQAIHIKILATTDSTYTFEYGIVGKTQKQRGIATKIK